MASVFMRRSFDAGRTWDAPRAVLHNESAGRMVAQQAVPVSSRSALLLLNIIPKHVPCGPGRQRCGKCVTYVSRSDDQGETWSSAQPLPGQSTWGSGVGNGIILSTGRLIAPRRADCCDCSGEPQAYVLMSDDKGYTWRAGARLALGWTECSVAELPNGSVVLSARALHGRAVDLPRHRRLFARSDDGGLTWAQTWGFSGRGGPLKDPDCFGSLASTPSSPALFFANPNSAKRRANMTIHRSLDGGVTWAAWRSVYDGQAAYSALTMMQRGQRMGLAFERDRRYKHVSFVRVAVRPP